MPITLEELVVKPKYTLGVWGSLASSLTMEEGQPLNVCEAICKLYSRSTDRQPKPLANCGRNTSNSKVKDQ